MDETKVTPKGVSIFIYQGVSCSQRTPREKNLERREPAATWNWKACLHRPTVTGGAAAAGAAGRYSWELCVVFLPSTPKCVSKGIFEESATFSLVLLLPATKQRTRQRQQSRRRRGAHSSGDRHNAGSTGRLTEWYGTS